MLAIIHRQHTLVDALIDRLLAFSPESGEDSAPIVLDNGKAFRVREEQYLLSEELEALKRRI